jgi:hypothetical protein
MKNPFKGHTHHGHLADGSIFLNGFCVGIRFPFRGISLGIHFRGNNTRNVALSIRPLIWK